jgi:hypothetical protein
MLSVKNYENAPSKSNKLKNYNFFCGILNVTDIRSGSGPEPGSVSQKYGSADPYPYQNVTDLEQ